MFIYIYIHLYICIVYIYPNLNHIYSIHRDYLMKMSEISKSNEELSKHAQYLEQDVSTCILVRTYMYIFVYFNVWIHVYMTYLYMYIYIYE
jgi:hypothetical protein